MPYELIDLSGANLNHFPKEITLLRKVKITRGAPMELNIPGMLKWCGLRRRDEFPEKVAGTDFYPEGWEILLLEGQNQYRRIRKNKLPF